MCKRIDCRQCGKPTWAGCGMHIEQALAGVPKADRCRCAEQPPAPKADAPKSGGLWSFFSKKPQP